MIHYISAWQLHARIKEMWGGKSVMPVTDIEQSLNMPHAIIMSHLRSLELFGYIRFTPSEKDIELTDRGRQYDC